MKNFADIKIREWHFIVLIFLLTILIYILGTRNLTRTYASDIVDYLIELNEEIFVDSISSRLCFVLFFVEDSDLCSEMNYNLNRMAKDKNSDVGFFKLNLEKYPVYNEIYNISGVPNILIFSNGEEIKRIMGIVPKHNLERIYNKTSKKERTQL